MSTDQFLIRRAESADIDQLVQLCSDHASHERAEYILADQKKSLREAMFGKQAFLHCLVVVEDIHLVGYTTFMKQFSTWTARYYVYMDCLFLSPQTRNHGLGQKLMDEVENFAKAENCSEIQWQTPPWNEGAIRFYERNGAFAKSKIRFFKKR